MKQIVCEMCDGTNFLKEDGMYVCQGCGMKFSAEEAKKLMREVEDAKPQTTTVAKPTNTEELDNLYLLARRAKDSNNHESAAKYYEMILVKDPNSWEANYYSVCFKALCCKIGEITSSIISIGNCIDDTFNLIINFVTDRDQRIAAVNEVVEHTARIAKLLYDAYEKHYNGIDASIRQNYMTEWLGAMVAEATTRNHPYICIFRLLGDDEYFMVNYGYDTLNNFLGDSSEWMYADEARAVLAKYDNIIAENKRKQEEELRRAQEQRNNKYWEDHAEERKMLEDERAELEAKIAALEKDVQAFKEEKYPVMTALKKSLNETLPIEEKVREQHELIMNLLGQRSALGLFKGKEKKAITARLDEVERPRLESLKAEAVAAKEARQAEVTPQINALVVEEKTLCDKVGSVRKRLDEIENELTMDR